MNFQEFSNTKAFNFFHESINRKSLQKYLDSLSDLINIFVVVYSLIIQLAKSHTHT